MLWSSARLGGVPVLGNRTDPPHVGRGSSLPPSTVPPAVPMPLEIHDATTEADWQAVQAVRQVVFVEEQACPPEEEWDEHDAPELRGQTVHHLLGTVSGLPVACARWRSVGDDTAKLERFAVLPAFRGRGLARQLVGHALDQARAAGLHRFVLHAQTYVTGLYEAFGFEPEGEVFDEAGIDHVKMTLTDS